MIGVAIATLIYFLVKYVISGRKPDLNIKKAKAKIDDKQAKVILDAEEDLAVVKKRKKELADVSNEESEKDRLKRLADLVNKEGE